MKAGMIFARKTTWRSRFDLEYLDETSSRKLSSRNQQDDGQKKTRPLRQFADYASKETPGQVHAGGFLHHLILINEDGSRTAPSHSLTMNASGGFPKRGSSTSGNIRPPREISSFSIGSFSRCRARCTTGWSMPE